MNSTLAIVLAAGKGTRMDSDLPKVLVEVCGRPMIEYVLDALTEAGVGQIVVVVGYRADAVRAALTKYPNVRFADQPQQLGTGHAVMVCREAVGDYDGPVVVVTGDSPLLQSDSVAALLAEFAAAAPACLLGSTHKENPQGLGRIVRDAAGRFERIVEEKDASPQQRRITEVNMSTYVFNCRDLFAALDKLQPTNAQGEYYITDCPAILKAAGKEVRALDVLKPIEALSINTVDELADVEAVMREARGS